MIRKHLPWALSSVFALSCCALLYGVALRAPSGFRAGSGPGVALGALALVLFVFAALLGLRRKRPAWHLGPAAWWLRAHLWVGVVAFGAALLHAGFRARGVMSVSLLVLLALVTVSGLFGSALRRILPVQLTRQVPRETARVQIPKVVERLRREADQLVAAANDQELARLYQQEVQGLLVANATRHPLLDPGRATRIFKHATKRVSPETLTALATLEDICAERRELHAQVRLERWLFGWRFVHVPLSFSLLMLTIAHAVMTLSY